MHLVWAKHDRLGKTTYVGTVETSEQTADQSFGLHGQQYHVKGMPGFWVVSFTDSTPDNRLYTKPVITRLPYDSLAVVQDWCLRDLASRRFLRIAR